MEILTIFRALPPGEAQEFFLKLGIYQQAELLLALPANERRLWFRLLDPDDAADIIQQVPSEHRTPLLRLLDQPTRNEVNALLCYAEDVAGGLMSPRYTRVRPDMTVAEAITYVRKQAAGRVETIYYVYVLGNDQRLLGVLSFRQLFAAAPERLIRDLMRTDLITVRDETKQEKLGRLLQKHGLIAIPVLDSAGHMVGIVTFDDVVDAVAEETTEDFQKVGGSEALDGPYLQIGLWSMLKKRAGWLTALFLGEMLTASAMGYFESEIARAVVLALFVPLMISSGGNAGSQASTLVIRAMALGEVRLADWWRVIRRELVTGLALGIILGTVGLVRILAWQGVFHIYGAHYFLIALTVAISLVGIVLWGSIAGSILPFILRRLGFDPASASTPFVATLVDVTGLIIYFTVANFVLGGTLL